MNITVIPVVVGTVEMVPKGLKKEIGDQRVNRDHKDQTIVKISKNTLLSLGDPRIFAVTLTPLKKKKNS